MHRSFFTEMEKGRAEPGMKVSTDRTQRMFRTGVPGGAQGGYVSIVGVEADTRSLNVATRRSPRDMCDITQRV